jgi:hypothetical protein
MNNLSKYREEAEAKYPYLPNEEDDLATREWNQRKHTQREAHIAARLMSEQDFSKCWDASAEAVEEYFENDYDDNGAIPQFSVPASVKAEYLASHTPALIDLEALLNDAMLEAVNIADEHFSNDHTHRLIEQYITDKIKSL